MPLPVSAMGVAVPAPLYQSSISRGGFTLPAPTPRMPPKPPFSSSGLPQTLQRSPTSRAIFCASRAICAGGMSPAGVFTRSRAQQTASATTWPRRTASRAAFASPRAEPSTVTRVSGFVSAFAVLYRSNR